MTSPMESSPSLHDYLEARLAEQSDLRDRVCRAFLIELHSRGIVSVDEIHRQAKSRRRRESAPAANQLDESVQVVRRWDETEKATINTLILDFAARTFRREEIDDLINLTRKRDEAQTLEEIANLPAVSFGLLADKIRSFSRLPRGLTLLTEKESTSARVALIRRLISDQLEFIGVAKHYLSIRDFAELIECIIGRQEGAGVIGGKAAGMILAAKIIAKEPAGTLPATVPVKIPVSYFLRSDVIEDFISYNGLQHLQDQKYKTSEEIHNDYPMLLELFKNADFPPEIVKQMQSVLGRLGDDPLIVRSSSLLEDRFGTTFAGKYRSVFVSNQGATVERMAELLGAIAEVYASTFHPDPLSYRQRHQLLDYSENMGVLIQKLVGRRLGRYFLPVWAGMAFSRNPYRRSPRIRPEDGLARIVFGLGTRAVDRVADDFPRMIPLGLPTLRPEVETEDIIRVSQKQVDVIDLESRSFTTMPIDTLLALNDRLAALSEVFSTQEHGFLRPLMGDTILAAPGALVVTFDRFAQNSPYPAFLRRCLQILERAYGCPVDIEFASDGQDFYLLQCRPQVQTAERPRVRVPQSVPPDRRIFSAHRDILSDAVHGIEFVVIVDPEDYNAVGTDDRRVAVARAIRLLNQELADRAFILMGPGRWGSRDMRLGIRVGYSDINNTRMLIEIARQKDGYLPEVSFGSHFFQDLMESHIPYLALYPDDPQTLFREDILRGGRNSLAELVPEAAGLADVVRVLHVPELASGMLLNVDMDNDSQEALAYLAAAGAGSPHDS
jgi:pyruvate,water dikinase